MTSAAPARRRLPVLLATLLAIGLSAPVCFVPIRDSDAGFHLALGRLFATHGLTFRNALAWTAPDYSWYPASYAYDLAAWGLTHALGPLGFQLWTALLLAATLALVAIACAELDAQGAWLAVPVGMLLIPRVTERPHLASWVVLAGVLALCVLAKTRGWGWRARAAAVAVIAVGSNFHAGAIFGAGLLGLFCLEAFLVERPRPRRELAIGALGLLAVLANPGGPFTLLYSVEHLNVQSVVVIQEFLRPTLRDQLPFFVLVPLALVGAGLAWRKWPALLAAAVVFAGLGFYAARGVFEFYLVAAPCLALGLARLRERWGALHLLAVPALAALAVYGYELDARYRALRLQPAFDPTALPVRAADFARREGLTGPYFNSFRDGGYLEYALDQPAFQDGRVLAWPQEFFAKLQEAETNRGRFQRYLRELGAEWAFALRRPEKLGGFRLFHESPDWALVYWDGVTEVYLRRDVPRFADAIARNEYRFFHPFGSILGSVAAAPPEQLPAYLAEVERYERTSPGDPFAALVTCGLARRMGRGDATAACDRAQALAATPQLQQLVAKARTLPRALADGAAP